jgi:hypothetical protein
MPENQSNQVYMAEVTQLGDELLQQVNSFPELCKQMPQMKRTT